MERRRKANYKKSHVTGDCCRKKKGCHEPIDICDYDDSCTDDYDSCKQYYYSKRSCCPKPPQKCQVVCGEICCEDEKKVKIKIPVKCPIYLTQALSTNVILQPSTRLQVPFDEVDCTYFCKCLYNGAFCIPVDGIYSLNAQVGFNAVAPQGVISFSIETNGMKVAVKNINASQLINGSAESISINQVLLKGDTVSVILETDANLSGVTLTTIPYTFFSILGNQNI